MIAWPSALVQDEASLPGNYRQMDALLARAQPLAVLLDLRGAASSSGRRRRMIEWTTANEAAIKRFVVAAGFVVRNELERGFITAVAWIKPPPVPICVFTERYEAETWLLEQLAEAKV